MQGTGLFDCGCWLSESEILGQVIRKGNSRRKLKLQYLGRISSSEKLHSAFKASQLIESGPLRLSRVISLV